MRFPPFFSDSVFLLIYLLIHYLLICAFIYVLINLCVCLFTLFMYFLKYPLIVFYCMFQTIVFFNTIVFFTQKLLGEGADFQL